MKKSKLILGLFVLAGLGVFLLQWQSIIKLRHINDSLSWQLQQLQQMARLQSETEHSSKFVAPPEPPSVNNELLRLRSEVTMLRQLTNEIARTERDKLLIEQSPILQESNNFMSWLSLRDPDAPLRGSLTHVTNFGRSDWQYEGSNAAGGSVYSFSVGPPLNKNPKR